MECIVPRLETFHAHLESLMIELFICICCLPKYRTMALQMLVLYSLAITLLFLLLNKFFTTVAKPDEHLEPPTVHIRLWDLWIHGTHVLDAVAMENMDRFPRGILTLKLLWWKIYVVNNPETTLAIQARNKHTGLGWVSVLVMGTMGGEPAAAMKRLFQGVDAGDLGNGVGFVHEYHKVELRTFSLGNSLDAMKRDFGAAFEPLWQSLRASVANGNTEVDMWQWYKKAITISVGRAVWGPLNPYTKDPALWEQFWTFNSSFHILKYRFPRIFAPRGAAAREKVVDAFVEYAEEGGFEHASALAQARYKVLGQTGIGPRDVARMAMPQGVGQFDNSATVSFALLSRILSTPGLLERVRAELEPLTYKDHRGRKTIEVVRIGDECPLLLSTFHEVIRLIAVGVTMRRVESDYPLTIKSDGTTYLLKAGNFIWGSGTAIHTSSKYYKDPQKFIPERFLGLKYPETEIPDIYRAFGGGGNICLGRHLARTIVPGAVGTLLISHDFEPWNGKSLCTQKREDLLLGHATPNPFGNTMAVLKPRLESGDVNTSLEAVL